MIKQPNREDRDYINDSFYVGEARRIAMLNKELGDIEITPEEEQSLIWLASWEDSTVKNIVSVFKKAKKYER